MTRRLPAIGSIMMGLALGGCSEPVPTVNMNVPAPGPQPAVKQGVLPIPKQRSNKPAPTTPNAL
jgi:hypothetical protein